MKSRFEDSVDFSRIVLEDICHNRFSVESFCMFFVCFALDCALVAL